MFESSEGSLAEVTVDAVMTSMTSMTSSSSLAQVAVGADSVEDPREAAVASNCIESSVPPQEFSYPIEDYVHPARSSTHDLKHSFSWELFLTEADFVAASVTAFKHAPMADCWEYIVVGMKVEVENSDSNDSYPGLFPVSYWVASVLRISGYYALLRYEGFGQDGSKDFWMSVASDKIHPVGWCATKQKPLIPPKVIQTKQTNWKDFLVKRLTGARTIPTNFYLKVCSSVGSLFKKGMKLEVVDKMRICQVRVATIKEITGRRLFVQYDNVDHNDKGFWCHEENPLIHPVGWARQVGHQIEASREYYDRCDSEKFEETDCTPDMFPEYVTPEGHGNFLRGMKIEAVDPLNLASVCVATVMKVLRFGYIMIRIDGYETDESGSDWFCYHASSPLIFHPGYCEKNNIDLKPPTGWEDNFSWYNYLRETKSVAAPVGLFCQNRDTIRHGFKAGMKVEAADQMDPRLICVSTISRVVGRLLKVHFDGWEEEYDQWMDCENVDIYPVGWAELVGHKLEGPRPMAPLKKEKRKSVSRKGKKRTLVGLGNQQSGSNSSSNISLENNESVHLSSEMSAVNSTSACVPIARKSLRKLNSPSGQDKPLSFTTDGMVVVESNRDSETTVALSGDNNLEIPTMDQENNTERFESSCSLNIIPRLVDSAGQASIQRGKDNNLNPQSWTVEEVGQFLEINECGTLVEAFTDQCVEGSQFLSLSKEDIMRLVNNKIGPCLKIENLLNLLRTRMNPAQARYLANIRK